MSITNNMLGQLITVFAIILNIYLASKVKHNSLISITVENACACRHMPIDRSSAGATTRLCAGEMPHKLSSVAQFVQ
jgi:hypothetical protein